MQSKFLIFNLFLIFNFTSSISHSKIVERVLAVVEGQMILQSDVENFRNRLKNRNLVNENLISFLNVPANAKSEKILLDYLISKKIILVSSQKDLNITNTNDLIDKELSDLAQQNKITVKQLRKEIEARGLSFSKYREFIGESSLIRSSLEKNVISQVRPTEEDFVSYLKQNGIDNIVPSYTYDLDQIFIPKNNPDAIKLASSINSENFKEFFDKSKNKKIETLKLGPLKQSDLSPAHAKAVSSIQQGEVSKIIDEPKGLRIFFMNFKRSTFNIPNTAQVRSLQKTYYDSKVKSQFNSWFNETKPQFFVRIND